MLEKRNQAGRVEPQAPGAVLGAGPLLPGLRCRLGTDLPQALGRPGNLFRRAQGERPGPGRVQDVVAEFRGQPGKFLLDGVEALPRLSLETDATVPGIAQQGFDDSLLGRVQRLPCLSFAQPFEGQVDGAALRLLELALDFP